MFQFHLLQYVADLLFKAVVTRTVFLVRCSDKHLLAGRQKTSSEEIRKNIRISFDFLGRSFLNLCRLCCTTSCLLYNKSYQAESGSNTMRPGPYFHPLAYLFTHLPRATVGWRKVIH